MIGMTEFMSERRDVRITVAVRHEDPALLGNRKGSAESALCFSRTILCIDPSLTKHVFREGAELRIQSFELCRDDGLCHLKWNVTRGAIGVRLKIMPFSRHPLRLGNLASIIGVKEIAVLIECFHHRC